MLISIETAVNQDIFEVKNILLLHHTWMKTLKILYMTTGLYQMKWKYPRKYPEEV